MTAGERLEVRSPRDGSLVTSVPVMDLAAVRGAVERARAAQAGWAARPPKERARVMKRLGEVFHDRGEEIAGRIRAETGKPTFEALAEIAVSVDLIRLYVRMAPKELKRRRVRTLPMLGKGAWVEHEPWGVVGAITPWNYPFILMMDVVTPALFAGNGVVVKPSEFTPWSALLLPELCAEAGVPDELVQIVTGAGGTGAAIAGSGVDRIVFTGSTATGRKVMAAAAERLVPVTLELGGKDPAVVLEDADLDRAARGIAYGAFFNAGQTCISVERVYVARGVHDAFVERLAERARALRSGTGEDADTGPMITEAQLGIVERQVEDALSKGARALTGGRRSPDEPRVYEPTVLVDVDPSMQVLTEETFGPVVAVVPVEDDADAVRQANALGYGLFASVWTADRERGLDVARKLRTGGASINDVLSHYAVPGLPMGGRGESGFGRRRGVEALREMSVPRTVLVDRLGLGREPWWFPYSAGGLKVVRGMLSWSARPGLAGLVGAVRRLLGRGG